MMLRTLLFLEPAMYRTSSCCYCRLLMRGHHCCRPIYLRAVRYDASPCAVDCPAPATCATPVSPRQLRHLPRRTIRRVLLVFVMPTQLLNCGSHVNHLLRIPRTASLQAAPDHCGQPPRQPAPPPSRSPGDRTPLPRQCRYCAISTAPSSPSGAFPAGACYERNTSHTRRQCLLQPQ
jgi:hypothetical protein